MTELKPCPFCGGEAEMLTAESMYGGNLYGVMCDCCACRTDVFDTEAEAIAAWNTRADDYRHAAEYWQRMYENTFAERTCQIDYERHCSNCGVYVRDEAVLVRKDLDDGAWTVVPKPINYCPNCGRKVVSE